MMAQNDHNGWPSYRALLFICFAGILVAQPVVRKRQRVSDASGTDFGETAASYVVERARQADKQAKTMMWLTGTACVAALVAAGAAVAPLVS
jgi:hypothetical protein